MKQLLPQACDYKPFKIISISLLLFLLILVAGGPSHKNDVYLDAALNIAWEGERSMIVSAADMQTAVSVVTHIGGEIESELWLIDAVAASLTYPEYNQLAQQHGILSIVNNNGVSTAVTLNDDSDDDEDDDNANPNRSDWVSNRRRILSNYNLDDKPKVPPILLSDGRVFVISEHGNGLILSQDGSIVAQMDLGEGPFKTASVAGSDGAVYVASEDKKVIAINADGSIRWQFNTSKKIKGGISLFESATTGESILYVVDEAGTVSAINTASGAAIWAYSYDGKKPGKAESPPVVAANGTIYIVMEKGHIFALDPTGSLKWVYIQDKGKEFKYPPQFAPDGSIYVVNKKESVVALYPDGSVKYLFEPDEKITAVPRVASDGTLFIPASERLYAINNDGSVRFNIESPQKGKFKSAPSLSPDGTQLYITLKEKWLFAINTTSGAIVWEYKSDGDLEVSPLIESNGDIHLVSKSGLYVVFSPDGSVLYNRLMSGELEIEPIFGLAEKSAILLTKSETVETVALLPESWDGTDFATPTSNPAIWNFTTIPSIDIGADELHDKSLQNDSPITGQGVTVAVLDSGVYIDEAIQSLEPSYFDKMFLGQADFVEDGDCPGNGSTYTQNDTYCWTTIDSSYDDYGHGSHIAGIIWNNLADVNTGVQLGIAPNAQILSIRVLDENGAGNYADIIEGIQFAIVNQGEFNIGVMNLSLSGTATVPYFVDPLNRAVEEAWAAGIVVVAAAGNSGPAAQTITVPGNDPYVITVGAVHSNQTSGYWGDDSIPAWSATGPTLDGFIKPDILAPGTDIVSFVYAEPNDPNSAFLAEQYPDYSESSSLFRMHGTSASTAVTSGVVALMLEANPSLTPDEVKFRLMASAKTAVSPESDPIYSILQQGVGRIWAPDAVNGDFSTQKTNANLNIKEDLSHPWQEGDSPDPSINPDLAYHYQGPVQTMVSDNDNALMYFVTDSQNKPVILGIATKDTLSWLDYNSLLDQNFTFENGLNWDENYIWSGGTYAWSGGTYAWSGGTYAWSGGTYAWSGNANWDDTVLSGGTLISQHWIEE